MSVEKYGRMHMIFSLQQFFDSEIYKNNYTFCGTTKEDLIHCSELELTFLYEKMNDILQYIETRSIFNLKGFGK